MTVRNTLSPSLALVGTLLFASGAWAAEPQTELRSNLATPQPQAEAVPDQAPAPAPSPADETTVRSALPEQLSLDELSDARGRATIVINDQDIDGTVTDNALGDYVAGAIALGDNALSNFSGVGNFIFNTGAQNNLQAGMTLTITFED